MVDYSKWKSIEISDDEDDTHPNIDTPSLFKWRHQARVERMQEMEKEKENLIRRKQSVQARLMDVKERIAQKKGDEAELKKEMEKIEKEAKDMDREEEEFNKREKKAPWNVDTISKPGFEKTVLNKQPKRKSDESMSEEERQSRLKNFIKENEKLCKQYGMLHKYDDSRRFLQDHPHLVSEDTANYLVIWAINLEMEKKHDLMAHVAHQCICMQYTLELAKQLEVDPRACVSSFFSKIQNCLPEYREQFDSEIKAFKERIQKRAQEKIDEAIAEAEEEERLARLGPGGVDPAEVFEELPEELQKCFESRDIELLQKTIANMPVDEAKYYMKRCVDSGLWVPNAADAENATVETEAASSSSSSSSAAVAKDAAAGDDKKPESNDKKDYKGVSSEDLD